MRGWEGGREVQYKTFVEMLMILGLNITRDFLRIREVIKFSKKDSAQTRYLINILVAGSFFKCKFLQVNYTYRHNIHLLSVRTSL